MKKVNLIILAGVTLLLLAFTVNQAINWQIKDGYALNFSGTKIEGNFEKINGDISFDENNLSTSKFDLSIEVASIATGNWLKNRHAKGNDW